MPESEWSAALARFERRQANKEIVSSDGQDFDPWENLLRTIEKGSGVVKAFNSDGALEYRIKTRYLLNHVIGIDPERGNDIAQGARLRQAMNRLGWSGPKNLWFSGEVAKGYYKAED